MKRWIAIAGILGISLLRAGLPHRMMVANDRFSHVMHDGCIASDCGPAGAAERCLEHCLKTAGAPAATDSSDARGRGVSDDAILAVPAVPSTAGPYGGGLSHPPWRGFSGHLISGTVVLRE